MTSGPSQQKLRERSLKARRALDNVQRERAGERIQRRFLRSRLFFSARAIGCYLSSRDEVDTSLVIDRCWRAGKRVYVPVVDDATRMRFVELTPNTRMTRNRFGLWEPTSGAILSAKSLDVVVTPVVSFDSKGNRVGMGGGYFDRAFSFLGKRRNWYRPKLVGFAFDCQKVEKIRANPWDIRLYRVLSEVD